MDCETVRACEGDLDPELVAEREAVGACDFDDVCETVRACEGDLDPELVAERDAVGACDFDDD